MQAQAHAKPDRTEGAFALVAACCRAAGDRTGIERAGRGVDWDEVLRLAGRHRVEGLVAQALLQARVPLPADVDGKLRQHASDAARRGLLHAAESARLQALLDDADIANLILKGAALDILAWGRIGLKQSWDIDLLVSERDVVAAAELLSGDGYRLHKPEDLSDERAWRQWIALAKECLFVHPRTGTAVELHWRVADTAALLRGVCALSPSRQVALAPGLIVRTLPADETFAYLCVHGASHAWSRLKWLADLAALVEGLNAAELAALRERAKLLGAGRCADVALCLCAEVLDLPAARGLAPRLRRDWRTRALVSLSIHAMTGAGGREIEDRALVADGILASQLLFADGWRFVLSEIRRQWVSLDDRRRLRLPHRWRGVYHLVRAPLFVWRRLRRTADRTRNAMR
jgi:Uncharacterised nucleotidyltransferase